MNKRGWLFFPGIGVVVVGALLLGLRPGKDVPFEPTPEEEEEIPGPSEPTPEEEDEIPAPPQGPSFALKIVNIPPNQVQWSWSIRDKAAGVRWTEWTLAWGDYIPIGSTSRTINTSDWISTFQVDGFFYKKPVVEGHPIEVRVGLRDTGGNYRHLVTGLYNLRYGAVYVADFSAMTLTEY